MLITISTKPIVKNIKQKTKYFRNKNILIETKYHIEITYLQFPNLHIIHIPECHLYIAYFETKFTLFYLLSFVFIRSSTRFHSSSLLVIHCQSLYHSFSLNVPLVLSFYKRSLPGWNFNLSAGTNFTPKLHGEIKFDSGKAEQISAWYLCTFFNSVYKQNFTAE